MLTPAGKKRGVAAVVEELDGWHKKNLSKYKWLRGGIQVIDAVCFFFLPSLCCVFGVFGRRFCYT